MNRRDQLCIRVERLEDRSTPDGSLGALAELAPPIESSVAVEMAPIATDFSGATVHSTSRHDPNRLNAINGPDSIASGQAAPKNSSNDHSNGLALGHDKEWKSEKSPPHERPDDTPLHGPPEHAPAWGLVGLSPRNDDEPGGPDRPNDEHDPPTQSPTPNSEPAGAGNNSKDNGSGKADSDKVHLPKLDSAEDQLPHVDRGNGPGNASVQIGAASAKLLNTAKVQLSPARSQQSVALAGAPAAEQASSIEFAVAGVEASHGDSSAEPPLGRAPASASATPTADHTAVPPDINDATLKNGLVSGESRGVFSNWVDAFVATMPGLMTTVEVGNPTVSSPGLESWTAPLSSLALFADGQLLSIDPHLFAGGMIGAGALLAYHIHQRDRRRRTAAATSFHDWDCSLRNPDDLTTRDGRPSDVRPFFCLLPSIAAAEQKHWIRLGE